MQNPNDDVLDLPDGIQSGWAGPDDAFDDTRLWLRWNPTEICYFRVLSAAPLFYPGHWVPAVRAYRLCTARVAQGGGQTYGLGCQYCLAGRGGSAGGRNMASERRVRHLVAVLAYSGEQHVFEFGEAVARQMQRLTGYQNCAGVITRTHELRGLALGVCREAGRPAGNVLVQLAPASLSWPDFLPDALDVAGALASSWKRAALHDGKAQPRLPVGF